MSLIYPKQIRAARTLLGMNQSELAGRVGVSPATIKRIEMLTDNLRVKVETLLRIKEVLEADGIIFIEPDDVHGLGVRLRDPSAR